MMRFALIALMLLPVGICSGGPRERVEIAEAAVWTGQNQFPDGENDYASKIKMVVKAEPAAGATGLILCRVHVADGPWCIPCNRQKEANGAGDARIAFEYTTDPSPTGNVPCTTFVDADGQTRTMDGFHTTQQVWEKIQRNKPPFPIQSNGGAGAIHARPTIQALVAWWREKIGEGVKVEARWDRSGAQSFPLLANGDWSAVALCGRYGHVQLAAKGAKGLAMQEIGFGYRIEGDDLLLDLDQVILKGFLSRQGLQASQSMPNQVSPGTILTIASIARGVWLLLHPSCDLQLGGNVSATAVLVGDKLTIDFQQCPSIRIVALFSFQLRVDRVEISEQAVRLVFGGSRLVKERSFNVE